MTMTASDPNPFPGRTGLDSLGRLLFITPNPIEGASERYRIYQFLPYLRCAGFACSVLPFATPTLYRAIQAERLAPKLLLTPFCYMRRLLQLSAISQYDAVVVHRGMFPFPWPWLETKVIRRHQKVIFDFDDAIHIGHQDIGATKYSWIYQLKYGSAVNQILRHSAHVIAGNRTLADHALGFNSQVSVIPTVVDLDQYVYRPPCASNETLTIGWVGSRSTSPYLVGIEDALRRLSQAHPGKIRFRLYGHQQRKLNLPNFESLPFSLATEIDDLRTIDIGVMPLPNNDWTRGKCAFKAIQYMALGIPTVVSPVGMATELIEHNLNGFVAQTPEEWFEALNHLINDLETRRRFSAQGRKTIEARYSLQAWGPRLSQLFQRVIEEPGAIAPARTVSAIN
jgi:glycosyltransferase involved in cell wall biosynthesis